MPNGLNHTAIVAAGVHRDAAAPGDGSAPVIPVDGERRTRSALWRILLLGGLVALIVGALFLLPVKQYLLDLLGWVRGLGAWGPASLVALYVAACVLFLPGWILTAGSGFAFGLVAGTITASLGSVLGVSAAFFVGRTLARGWIERKIAGNERFRVIDEAVGREGFKIVLLTRLSPAFPFNLLNYAFGVTRVRFRDFFFASWIGMFPGTVLYVYLGTAAKSLAEIASGGMEGGPARYVFLAVGLMATVAVTVVLTRIARRSLKKATIANTIHPYPTQS